MKTRRALLISNPGEPFASNYCKGVYADIKNYQEHLMAAVGGAWTQGEIVHLDRPSEADVKKEISELASFDYTFIAFSGHGYYSATKRDTVLELRRSETISLIELRRAAVKRTIILDCCQEVIQERTQARKFVSFGMTEAAHRQPAREACKKLFFDSVDSAAAGLVVLTSCSPNETASDDDVRGGRYTGSLFECIEDWVATTRTTPAYHLTAVLQIPVAHECAAKKTRLLSANFQNPIIEKPRSSPYFPIAVFA